MKSLPAEVGVALAARDVVFFDLDGTLTDSRKGIISCLGAGLAAVGAAVPPPLDLERYIGPPLHETFSVLLGPGGDVHGAVSAFRDRYGSVGLFEKEVYSGIPEALQTLREGGRRLFVVTSKPEPFAERIIDHFGLRPWFDGVHGSKFSGERAHKGELLGWVLAREGLAQERCVMVGDREHDIRGALQNGILATGVLWGFGSEEELRRAGANHIVERVPELLDWPAMAGAPER